uniref:Nucleotide exchange factor Fes1 domain-containing protein n=1 Tax=Clastoptera arizonana TaxID=38151 RepID=A0A1B6CYS4_9HEMI
MSETNKNESDTSSNDDNDKRFHERDMTLKDVLKLTQKALPRESINETCQTKLNREDYGFVQYAMDMLANPIAEIKIKLNTLNSIQVVEPGDNFSVYEESLDDIVGYLCDIDIAKDFEKIGGFKEIYPLLKHFNPSIRWRAAAVYAECSQNHDYCQIKLFEEKEVLAELFNLLKNDPDSTVKFKALSAVSCIFRDNKEGLKVLMEYDGLYILINAMECETERFNSKAAFFLSCICESNPEVKDKLIETGYAELLSKLIIKQNEFEDRIENLLLGIESLIRDNNKAVSAVKKTGLLSHLNKVRTQTSIESYILDIIQRLVEILAT